LKHDPKFSGIQLTFLALMRSLHKSRHKKEDDFLIGMPRQIANTCIPDGWNPPPERIDEAERPSFWVKDMLKTYIPVQ
jgi:hypothetical protein